MPPKQETEAKQAAQPGEKPAETTTSAQADKAAAADVVKLFKGHAVRFHKEGKDGKVEIVERDLTTADLLSVKDHGDRVVVVTIDGQKLEAGK